MANETIGQFLKRQAVSALLERFQSVNLEQFGAPKAEDAVKFENVEETLNIPYMNRGEVPLAMDVFQPIVPEGTELPVIVTIHGGGLTMGDRKLSRPFGRVLASKGYLVFSIEYRLAPKADVCMELDDVCAGLDLVGESLVNYDVDFGRMFIAAESAGAYLATYVTAMKGSTELQEAIGYKPSRMQFKAIGLMSGMLYTRSDNFSGRILAEQVYGAKRTDENFLKYMDPEHPEILNNLPPAFFITSKADFISSYSFRLNEAMKRAGKPCHLLYYGDDDLSHAFTTLQTDHPKALDSIDKMLAWFEEQAQIEINRQKSAKSLQNKKKKMLDGMADGSFDRQKAWKYIKECAGIDANRLSAPAIMDGSGTVTYAQMFEQWERYARVFSGLGMTGTNESRVAVAGAIAPETIFAFYGLNMTGACVSMVSCSEFLNGGHWKTLLEEEQITDLVITDFVVTPQIRNEIRQFQTAYGLKHVILLHTRMGGPSSGYAEMLFDEMNCQALKRIPEIQYMDELLNEYRDTAIRYSRKGCGETALICHSYRMPGDRTVLTCTDQEMNAISTQAWQDPPEKHVHLLTTDFSAARNMNEVVHRIFAEGGAIVTTFFGFPHPKFLRAVNYYKADRMICSRFMLDQWMRVIDLKEDTFASLSVIEIDEFDETQMESYAAFLKAHGFAGELRPASDGSVLLHSADESNPSGESDASGKSDASSAAHSEEERTEENADISREYRNTAYSILTETPLMSRAAYEQKKQMEQFKAFQKEMKDSMPKFRFDLSEMTKGMEHMMDASSLPRSLKTVSALMGILSGDQEIKDYDFED